VPRAERGAEPLKPVVREVRPELWADVVRLFGERGACGGCWCMHWRTEKGEAWEDVRGAPAKRRLRSLVMAGKARAVLAYDGDEPVGWCTFGRRQDFPKLQRSRTLACQDAEDVVAVPCFYVASRYRGRRVATALLREVIRILRREKARLVEGYPVRLHDEARRDVPGMFVWTGTVSLFEKQGFRPVDDARAGGKVRVRKPLR